MRRMITRPLESGSVAVYEILEGATAVGPGLELHSVHPTSRHAMIAIEMAGAMHVARAVAEKYPVIVRNCAGE